MTNKKATPSLAMSELMGWWEGKQKYQGIAFVTNSH